jgi:hypothetical protein
VAGTPARIIGAPCTGGALNFWPPADPGEAAPPVPGHGFEQAVVIAAIEAMIAKADSPPSRKK